MTDVLAERMSQLIDVTPSPGWLDVRRRTRTRRRRTIATIAIAAALVVSVAAFAATNNWIFGSNTNAIYGITYLQFHGREYSVQVDADRATQTVTGRLFTLVLSRRHQSPAAPRATDFLVGVTGGSILAVPGLPQKFLPHAPKPTGPAFGAMNYDEAGGEIWFGDSRPDVTRITITDSEGRVFRAETGAPPRSMPLAFRFWAIPLPHSTAETIAGYDSHGKLIERRSIWGLKSAMFLH